MVDLMLKKLIDECGLMEGRDGGDYYSAHGKTCISLPGSLKIQAAHKVELGQPLVIECAGRVVVYGESRKEGETYWTTGEANPNGRAVEGSHPVAMAEKRWRVRAILGIVLDPTLRTTVYGEDEFSPEMNAQPAQQVAPAQPPTVAQANPAQPAGVPEYVAKLPKEWNNLMGRFAEATHMDRADFETAVYDHITLREWQGKWFTQRSTHPTFGDFALGHSKNGKPLGPVALHKKKDAEEIAARLESGEDVELTMLGQDYQRTKVLIASRFNNSVTPAAQPDQLDDVPF